MASLSITALSNFFPEERKSICKGENHYKSDHVESFFYNAGARRGQVHVSMKEKSYKVMVSRAHVLLRYRHCNSEDHAGLIDYKTIVAHFPNSFET